MRAPVFLLVTLGCAIGFAQTAPPPTAPPTVRPTQPGQVPGVAQPGMPARDIAQPKMTGTARIRGVVTASDTGAPVRQVLLRAGSPELREGRGARTDADGRYEITDLPAGRYTLAAMKPGFVNATFGQRTATEIGRPIELKDGEVFQANFLLERGGVVAGRVVDEFGEPLADVTVGVMRYQSMRGRKRLVPAGRTDQTNDLGQYRIWGLPPGDYLVNANARNAIMMMAGPVAAGPANTSQAESGYAPTFFPGTPNPSEAQTVTLAPGGEAVADFALVPARVVQVSGRLLDSTGKPVTNGQVRVVPTGDAAATVPMFFATGGIVTDDGTFTIRGVAPGNYTLFGTRRDFRTRDDPKTEVGELPIVVSGEDLTGIVLTTRPGGTASGQIVIEGGTPPPFPASRASIFLQPMDPARDVAPFTMSSGPQRVNDDWTFELTNIFEKVNLGVTGLSGGYALKAVMIGGRDITETGLEVRPGRRVTGLQVIVSNRFAELLGTVTNDKGEPEPNSTVLVFPEDGAKWTESLFSRYVRPTRPDQSGRYTVRTLPAGEYLVVALESLERENVGDPEYMERLRSIAKRVQLGDTGQQILDLKVQKP